MKLVFDPERCVGHGRCYALAPALLDSDDRGHAVLLVDGDVPADLQDKARTAVANCPEDALRLDP